MQLGEKRLQWWQHGERPRGFQGCGDHSGARLKLRLRWRRPDETFRSKVWDLHRVSLGPLMPETVKAQCLELGWRCGSIWCRKADGIGCGWAHVVCNSGCLWQFHESQIWRLFQIVWWEKRWSRRGHGRVWQRGEFEVVVASKFLEHQMGRGRLWQDTPWNKPCWNRDECILCSLLGEWWSRATLF